MKYSFEYYDLGVAYHDIGPWRNYEISGSGDTVEEFLNDLTISEIDQDGGTLRCYGIEDAPSEVEEAIESLIESTK